MERLITRAIDRISAAIIGALALALIAVLAGIVDAGPLDPTQAPGPTMKTLQEVEPRTPVSGPSAQLFTAGSYYLTGDVTDVQIAGSDITLDLNGFAVGPIEGQSAGPAIDVMFSSSNITIRNGTVRASSHGINANETTNVTVEDVRAIGNTLHGIWLEIGTVRNVVARDNSGIGILVSLAGTVSESEATGNGAGIKVGDHSRISGVITRDNGGHGIDAGQGVLIEHCTAHGNGGAGIIATFDVSISECTVSSNMQSGINGGQGANIQDTSVHSNTGDGIRVTNGSLVEGNLVTHNTGSGVHATGTGNRIVGNSARSNGKGIDVDSFPNLIVGNSALVGAIAYEVAAGNAWGPVVTAADVASGAATNPHANYGP